MSDTVKYESSDGAGRVLTTICDGVADVRLNRPDKLNALDESMIEALIEAGEHLSKDPSVRVVVLSGTGRSFCAGLDLARFAAMSKRKGAERSPDRSREYGDARNRSQHGAWVWAELPVPVIAAVHGVAFGGGLQIALAADLRIVNPSAQLSVLEIRWGLIPDMTGSYVLPRLVGTDVAKELTWTGRIVNGEEAQRIGLATRVSDRPLDEALALASDIATKSPDAIRAAKRLLSASLNKTPREQFSNEEAAIDSLKGTTNQREAVESYFEKRPANYIDFDSVGPTSMVDE